MSPGEELIRHAPYILFTYYANRRFLIRKVPYYTLCSDRICGKG